MAKIAVTNPGKSPMYITGRMIPPGETRHFDESEVPAHLRPKPPAPEPEAQAPPDPMAELAAKTAREIIARIPALSSEDLTRLEAVERSRNEGARKTVLEAISNRMLELAGG